MASQQYIDNLVKELNHYSYCYHVLDDPVVSDAEYDLKIQELAELENDYPQWVHPASPLNRVGEKVSSTMNVVNHDSPMLSLDNIFTHIDLEKFFERVHKGVPSATEWVCEPKMDGVAISLHYMNGILSRAVTRGDGVQGEDVTHTVKTIKTIPLQLSGDYPEKLEVRGEIYIEKQGLKELNERALKNRDKVFANCRNAASGSIRLLDAKISAQRPLKCYVYALLCDQLIPSHQECLSKMSSWGFAVNPFIKTISGLEGILKYYDHILSIRDQLPYEIDGVVYKLNNIEDQEKLGYTNRSPRWACAHKFPSQQVTTLVKAIDVQVGRTGALTPVAVLEPCEVGGVCVQHATLHNFEDLDRKGVRVGDTVFIQRAGDVIPEVCSVVLSKRPNNALEIVRPEVCPECDTRVVMDSNGVIIRCPNEESCPAQIKGAIEHYASRRAMDIDGLGSKTVSLLVDNQLVTTLPDLYHLSLTQISSLPGFAHKSSIQLIDAIKRSKNTDLYRFIFGLGIRGVGLATAKTFSSNFKTLNGFLKASKEELEELPDIGPIVAENVINYLKKERTGLMLEEFSHIGMVFKKVDDSLIGHLNGKSFVFTGTMSSMSRTEASDWVVRHGGKVVSSLSKKVSYLVVGDKPGSKLAKANKLGVNVLDEGDFVSLMSSND